jgi:signal transduction histidine kinase
VKFWQKIFFGALILFIVIFNIAGTFLLQTYHRGELEREVERGLNEQYSMGAALSANIQYAASRMGGMENVSDTVLARTIQDYSRYYGLNNVFIQIYDENNKELFGNFAGTLPKERPELVNVPQDRRQYIIRDADHSSYLFVSGIVRAENRKLVFVYIRDIGGIYASFKQQTRLFFWISAAASAASAFAMLFLSLWLTRSVKRLNRSAQVLSGGNYAERVAVSSKDELGELSVNFNRMAGTIEEKISELERTAEERERFVDNLTHELKTPLTSIIGYAGLLRTADCSEEQRERALSYLYEASKRLENLSFKLMDLIYLKRTPGDFQTHSAEEIVKSSALAVESTLTAKNIALQTDCEPCTFPCDKDLVVTLLVNLIDNAAKASSEGQTVRISAKKNRDRLVFCVTDRGKGIDREEIGKITQPFYTVDKSRSRKSSGVGLGLSLCSLIAGLHGAELGIESEKGSGTAVSVKFPLQGFYNSVLPMK